MGLRRSQILLVADSSAVHADLIERSLQSSGASYLRLNTEFLGKGTEIIASFSDSKLCGEIKTSHRQITLDSIGAVWWFSLEHPLLGKSPSEPAKQWIRQESPACAMSILASLSSFYLNHPNFIHCASLKVGQMLQASRIGFLVPPTHISANPKNIRKFRRQFGPIVFKTFSHPSHTVKGQDYVVYTSRVDDKDLFDSAQNRALESCLCCFQAEIPKRYEIRVTVVGSRVFAAEIHSQVSARTSVDWRRYDIANTPHYPHELPKHVIEKCLLLTQHFQLSFNTIDLIVDPNGKYWFLEMNPNGLWAWIELLTGLPISNAIADLLISHAQKKTSIQRKV